MEKFDIVIIGAGIVGMATAHQLKEKNPDLNIIVLDKEGAVSQHQTGHNSGVIHSGIYYKPGSLKAQNCKKGYKQLLAFCDKHSIDYDLCGKIIVASDGSELQALENIYNRGLENGLQGLKKINREEIKDYEPHCTGMAGIFVPQTGIIDYTVVTEKMAAIFQEKGGHLKLSEKVIGIRKTDKGYIVETTKGTYPTNIVVNCAGLYSDKIAEMTMGKLGIKILPFRGEYYDLIPERYGLVKNLIYPVPDPKFPFLGVHFTRMIDGGVEAGPNAVLAYGRESYDNKTVNIKELGEILGFSGFLKVGMKYWQMGLYEMYRSYSKTAFTKALQKLIPEIQKADLVKGSAGIRAQACDKNGNLIDDFLIFEDKYVVNVCNAPSPAATSCLSIGKTIAEKVMTKIGE